jgi:hypothetical protein
MQNRNFYRINYPPASRPALLLGGRPHEIVNLSEEGLMFDGAGGDRPRVGDPVSGVIVFADQERLEVSGTVLRTAGSGVVLRLDRRVPFAKILSEQRRFLKHRPDL